MAEKKFFVDINLQGSALKNATIGNYDGLPKAGSFGFNGTRLRYYTGTSMEDVANLSDISAITGGLIFQGGYDPTTDTPDITDGTALKGFFWAATAAGTFLGESVQVGDSIVAKVDAAGATIADWLILQGNVVIATDLVDGISRLATQTEANDGTEGGAVVITPATLQGKIDAQITPEISSKLPLAGGTMTGSIDLAGSEIQGASAVRTGNLATANGNPSIYVQDDLDFETEKSIINLPAPTNGGDAANKTYVDDQDALKLSLTGGTMSGTIDMGTNQLTNVNLIGVGNLNGMSENGDVFVHANLDFSENNDTKKIINLPAPTADGDAANKLYVDGAAATAESNAAANTAGAISQEVTDRNNAIKALSFTGTIEGYETVSGWTYDGVSEYYAYVTHNLNNKWNVVTTSIGEQIVEFNVQLDGLNTILLRTNILPTETTTVSIVNAGGNL